MGRTPPRADTALADLRAYFGLPQWLLAGYLTLTDAVYREYEAGRRRLPGRLIQRILPLLAALPPTVPPPPDATPPPEPLPEPPTGPGAPPLAPDPLVARLDACRHTAARLRREARPYAQRARYAARWAAALPGLRAAPPFSTEPRAAEWLAAQPTALSPADLSAWHLLRARAAGLDAEAAALAALLG